MESSENSELQFILASMASRGDREGDDALPRFAEDVRYPPIADVQRVRFRAV